MFKRIIIPAFLVIFIAIFLMIGFPLIPGGLEADYAEQNPTQTARCFDIGDLDDYLNCLSNPNPRLARLELVETVTNRVNQVFFPFGYLFTICLAIFLMLAVLIIWTGIPERKERAVSRE